MSIPGYTEPLEEAEERPRSRTAERVFVLKPSGDDRAKLLKDIKFTDVDGRIAAILDKDLKAELPVELVSFGSALKTAAVAWRLERRRLTFCDLKHLLLLRRQATKNAEKDPGMAAIDWRFWVVAAANEVDDSLKADPADRNTIDVPLILNPYITQIGGNLYLALHSVEIEWPAGTQFLVRKK